MDGDLLTKLAILTVLIAASAFFAISESSLFSLGLFRVRRLKKTAQKSYLAAQKLLSEPTKLISTVLIGNELINTAISVVGTSLVYQLLKGRMEHQYVPLAAIACVLPFILIFGEIIPKTLGLKHAERFVSLNAVPLLWFSKMIRPVRNALVWVPDRLLRMIGEGEKPRGSVSEDVFRTMVDAGTEEGVLNELEQRLIHNVFSLDDVHVSGIMTPLQKTSALRKNMKVADAMHLIEKEKYSRYPVLDETGHHVAGVLYAKDLLASEPVHVGETLQSFLRPPVMVLKETTALELFAQFRSKRTHFAVVVDKVTAQMQGVVTLDDVLEEVFGHIRDERDIEEGGPFISS